MKLSLLLAAAALHLLVLMGGVAHAEKADRFKPMQLEADRMQHDEGKQLTQLSGNVQAVKGTLTMRAAHMDVQQDSRGQQLARFRAEPGQRVFFRQKREGLNEFIEGEATEAEYDSQLDRMVLTGQAEVRILRDGRLADQMQGQRIVYNNSTEVLNVDGKASDASASPGTRQRVRAVLAPRDSASVPASPVPPLRASPRTEPGVQKP